MASFSEKERDVIRNLLDVIAEVKEHLEDAHTSIHGIEEDFKIILEASKTVRSKEPHLNRP